MQLLKQITVLKLLVYAKVHFLLPVLHARSCTGGGDKVNTFTSTSDASSVTLSPEFSALLRCISVPFVQHVIQLGKQSRAGRRCGRINAVATTMTSVVIELKKPVDSRAGQPSRCRAGVNEPTQS